MPSLAFGVGAGGINLTPNLVSFIKNITILQNGTLLGGASYFNYTGNGCTASVNGGTATINCTGSGGGGGAGGGFIFSVAGGNVSFSTIAFPGATVTSDGQGFSSVTFASQINSTFTAFAIYSGTSDARANTWIVFRATSDQLFNTLISSIMALSVSTDAFKTFTLAVFSTQTTQFNTIISTEMVLRAATATINNLYAGVTSTQSTLFDNVIATMQAIRFSTAPLDQKNINGSVTIYIGGVQQGNATTINFNTNLTGSMSGSTATINGSAGGSGLPLADFIAHTTTADLVDVAHNSTMTALSVSTDAFKTFTLAVFSTQTTLFNNIISTEMALSASTDAFKTFTLNVFSTQTTLFNTIISSEMALSVSTDALKIFTLNVFSTQTTLFNTVISTEMVLRSATSTIQGFVAAEFSTQTALFDQVISTEMILRTATSTINNFYAGFTSTNDAQHQAFNNFRTTTDARLIGDNFGSHLATQPVNLQSLTASSGTFTSSLTVYNVIVTTLGILSASTTDQYLTVSGSSITFGGIGTNAPFTLVFASAPDTTAGKNHLIWTKNGSGFYSIGSGGDATTAGGSGYNLIQNNGSGVTQRTTLNFLSGVTCSDNGGTSATDCTGTGGSGGGTASPVFSFSPANGLVLLTTVAVNGSGFNKVTTDGVGMSSWTIGTSTLPFIRISVPATALKGRPRQFSGSDIGGGISITTSPSTTPDGDGKLQLDYYSFAPSTRQYAGFQNAFSTGGTNGWVIGSTVSFDYSGFVSSGAGAGKQVSMALQGTCLGGGANIQTAAWGSSVTLNLPDITSNFVIRNTTRSAAITLGGACFGGSPIAWRLSRNVDGNDTISGATGQYFNIMELGIYIRKSDVAQDDRYAQ